MPVTLACVLLVALRVPLTAAVGASPEEDARKALEAAEREHGAASIEAANALDSLVQVLFEKRTSGAEATRLAARAAELKEKLLGPDDTGLAKSLNNLGAALYQAGDAPAARPKLERALSIWTNAKALELPAALSCASNLARMLLASGEYDAAITRYEQVLAARETSLGPEHPDLAKTLANLADALFQTGEYPRSRALLERAAEISRKAFGPDHPQSLGTVNLLAGLLQRSGELDGAQKLFEEVLASREKRLETEPMLAAQALNNLAMCLADGGEARKAVPLQERALAIWEKARGPDHADTATGLNNLAWMLHESGDLARARPLYERALRIRETALPPGHPDLAWTIANLAALHRDLGDVGESLRLETRALEVRERALGPRHPLVAESLARKAALLVSRGDLLEAFEAALRAEELGREHLRLGALAWPERQALAYAAVRPSGLGTAVSAAAASRDPGLVRRALDMVIRSRALVLDEMVLRRRSASGSAAGELVAASRALSDLLVRGAGAAPPEQYPALLDGARKRLEAAEAALAAESGAFRADRSAARVGLEDVAGALPESAALVAFVLVDAAAGARGEPARYFAFVLRAGNPHPALVELGPAAAVDSAANGWIAEAARGRLARGRDARAAEDACRRAGEALRRAAWDPVAARLEGVTLAFIVPDGEIQLVSLAALPAGAGGKYVIEERPAFHYLSAERDLVATTAPPRPGAAGDGEGRLLAVGGADFDDASSFAARAAPAAAATAQDDVLRGRRPGCPEFEEIRFEALPGSAREATAVARAWGNDLATVLTGARATETAFKAAAPGARVIHLATHAFFLAGECGAPSAGTRGIGGIAAAGPPRPTLPGASRRESPLMLAGLALAGANRRSLAGPEEDDGILTAEEVASLDLSAADWVVLSACDTGVGLRGRQKAGEGILGLRRAFRLAGARTLVLSLWQVEDEAAREWMAELYEARFKGRLSTSEAVREASLRVLSRLRSTGDAGSTHPFRWAAFVAAGEWR